MAKTFHMDLARCSTTETTRSHQCPGPVDGQDRDGLGVEVLYGVCGQ